MPEPLAYLDHAATTPLRPEARAAMLPWLGERFGNPSGAHRVARAARQAVDEARDAVAEVVGLPARRGGVHQRRHRGRQPGGRAGSTPPGPARCCAARSSTTPCSARWRRLGGRTVPVDATGLVDLDALDGAC